MIESPDLARAVEEGFARLVPEAAYEVRLAAHGALAWIERRGADAVRHDVEPGTTAFSRGLIWLLSLLPIEGLL